MLHNIKADYLAILNNDPAVRSKLEALLCYPGFHALTLHRLNHFLWSRLNLKLLARIGSQIVRFFTGIEIHPGATIGKGVFIDHGVAVVIGETAVIEDYVTIYHCVTLGGTGKHTGKRHPTVKAHSVLGAHSIILGNITIGAYSKIGAGAIVLKDIAPHSTVIGVPTVQRIIANPSPVR
jgi:serine O-acetyltransferase